MKKGPLASTEKSFINENRNSLTSSEIAEKLDRSVSIIDNYLEKNNAADSTETPEHNNDQPKAENADMNLYARNKDRGVVIMTENASMSADQKRKTPNVYDTRKYRNVIHKIKED